MEDSYVVGVCTKVESPCNSMEVLDVNCVTRTPNDTAFCLFNIVSTWIKYLTCFLQMYNTIAVTATFWCSWLLLFCDGKRKIEFLSGFLPCLMLETIFPKSQYSKTGACKHSLRAWRKYLKSRLKLKKIDIKYTKPGADWAEENLPISHYWVGSVDSAGTNKYDCAQQKHFFKNKNALIHMVTLQKAWS